MDISTEQINAFHGVATTGSFSKAGEKIYRTQSAVSIQIARLEDSLGQKLFHRSTRQISLTDAGEIFLTYVDRIQRLLKEAEQELLDLQKMKRGKLVICTSDTTACYRLPTILQTYKKRYPGIEIVLRNATSLRTISLVSRNEVELGIATLSYLEAGLETIPLFNRSDVVICHPKHPLAFRKEIFLKDLEPYSCVLLDGNCSSRRILDDTCEKSRVNLKIAMELSSIEVVKSFVSIDAGVSIVPEVAIKKEIAEGKLASVKIREFKSTPKHAMGAIYRKDRYLSVAAREFLNMLEEIMQ